MDTPIPTQTNFRRDLAVAVAAAFFVRLSFLLAVRRVIDMADAIHYINMARQFAAGNFLGFDDNLPVLYSLLGAGVYQLIPDWEYAFWTVSLIASTLLVIPVYLISHTLHGRNAARVAVAMVCVWPWLVDYAGRISPDALAVTLWFSSIGLIYTGVEKGGKAVWLAPFALFALHLTRPEGTFLMLAAPLGAWIVAYGRGRPQYIRAGVITGLVIILLGSYALSMRLAIGAYTVSYRAPIPEEVSLYFSYGGIEFVRTFVRLLFTELPVMLGPFLMVFLGVGLFHRVKIKPRPAVVGSRTLLRYSMDAYARQLFARAALHHVHRCRAVLVVCAGDGGRRGPGVAGTARPHPSIRARSDCFGDYGSWPRTECCAPVF